MSNRGHTSGNAGQQATKPSRFFRFDILELRFVPVLRKLTADPTLISVRTPSSRGNTGISRKTLSFTYLSRLISRRLARPSLTMGIRP